MQEIKVSKRYAKSIIGLAQERKSLEETHGDMQQLLSACRQNPELSRMLKNPLIKPDKKHAILKTLFTGRITDLSMAFIKIIVRKRREQYLEEIAAEFTAQYKKIKGITSATVISATPLDASLRAAVSALLKNLSKLEVALEEKVDPSLIGGFVLRYGDVQYDASIAKSLSGIRMGFNTNLYQKKA
jgi:F-type H+-transporting ATPase subunit delta